jgi:GrpB-like predicted nucleotidyltransferase (UPF0157 family)
MGFMRNIVVVPYNESWPHAYASEARRIEDALAPLAVTLHHIGSTAVPDLAAKPVIDVLLVIRNHRALDERTPAMEELGYEAKGEFGIRGRRFFTRGPDEARTHHVHAYEKGHPEIARHLDFRDFLRAHPAEARRYGDLKARLASAHRDDIEAYIEGKASFILDAIRRGGGGHAR